MEDSVRKKERRIARWLAPYESYIVDLQSALSWESPVYTAIVLLALHVAFAIIHVHGLRLFFLIPATILAATVTDLWKNIIWPEIRVPPEFDDDPEDWTPVSARAMSVPEISVYVAKAWCSAGRGMSELFDLRRRRPRCFALSTSLVLAALSVVGLYVPGIVLAYLTMLLFFAWPAAIHYGVPDMVASMVSPLTLALACPPEEEFVPHTEPPDALMHASTSSRVTRRTRRAAKAIGDISGDEEERSMLPSHEDDYSLGSTTLRENMLATGLPTAFPGHDFSEDDLDIDDLPLDEAHYDDDDEDEDEFLPQREPAGRRCENPDERRQRQIRRRQQREERLAEAEESEQDALNYNITGMVASGFGALVGAAATSLSSASAAAAAAVTGSVSAARRGGAELTSSRQSSNGSEFEMIDPDEEI